jgi:hypothetical protein
MTYAVPTVITVACTVDGCAAAGRPARVYLQLVALGVVEWPVLRCMYCGGHMAQVGIEEDAMAKITAHGGPSNAHTDEPAPVAAEPAPAGEPAEQHEESEVPADAPPADTPAEEPAEGAKPEPEPADKTPRKRATAKKT